MSAVTSFAGFMKKHVLGQTLIRRNPYYYERSSNVLERGEAWEYERRRTWVAQQVRRTLQLAKRAEYGRSVRGGDTLASWPLLDKESLRARPLGIHHGIQMALVARDYGRDEWRTAQGVAVARSHRLRAGDHRSGDPVGRRRCAHGAHRGAARRQSARHRSFAQPRLRGHRRRPHHDHERECGDAHQRRAHRQRAREVWPAIAVRVSERARDPGALPA